MKKLFLTLFTVFTLTGCMTEIDDHRFPPTVIICVEYYEKGEKQLRCIDNIKDIRKVDSIVVFEGDSLTREGR